MTLALGPLLDVVLFRMSPSLRIHRLYRCSLRLDAHPQVRAALGDVVLRPARSRSRTTTVGRREPWTRGVSFVALRALLFATAGALGRAGALGGAIKAEAGNQGVSAVV